MTKPSQAGFPSLGNTVTALWSTLITEEPNTMSYRFMSQFTSQVRGTSLCAGRLPWAVPSLPTVGPWLSAMGNAIGEVNTSSAWRRICLGSHKMPLAVSFNHMSGKQGIKGSRNSFHSFPAKFAQVQKKALLMLGSCLCSAVRHGKAQSSSLLPEIRNKCIWGFLFLKGLLCR